MAEPTIQDDASVSAGGFRIVTRPDELTVTANGSSVKLNKKSIKGLLLIALGGAFAASCSLFIYRPTDANPDVVSWAILTLLIAGLFVWAYLSGSKNLHCTRDSLEVVQISCGRVKNRQLFPKNAVIDICYTAVAWSEYGSIYGLQFDAEGKKVHVLHGLQSPEAQLILKQLERLGFDVVYDVAMPMMVQMALERRQSWFSR
jgi:hypothetical protein